MAYKKPKIVAENKKTGSFAAGCPAKGTGTYRDSGCRACERTQ